MDDLFEELVGYLMQEEANNIQENTVVVDRDSVHNVNHDEAAADHNSIMGGINDDHNLIFDEDDRMMSEVAMMNSFNIADNEQPADGECYNPHFDLHCNDDYHDDQLGSLLYDQCVNNHSLLDFVTSDNNLSDNSIQCDRVLLDITNTSLEDCDLDQYFNLVETPTMQQKTDPDVCRDDHHQPQLSPPSIIHQHRLNDNDTLPADCHCSPEQQQQLEEEELQQQQLLLGKQTLIVQDIEEEEDVLLENDQAAANDDDIGDDETSSKNLKSERNRRRRLNQQYLKLRSIVPNITKMDKRTVLVDALAYLQDILRQTNIEIENQNSISPNNSSLAANEEIDPPLDHHNKAVAVPVEKNAVDASGNDGQFQPLFHTLLVEPVALPPHQHCAIFPAIVKMEAQKLDEERYVLEIVHNKALRTRGLVQRSVEMLEGFVPINVAISNYDEHHVQSSNFLRAMSQLPPQFLPHKTCVPKKNQNS
ncbi:hypothetical protein MKX01_035412 [Papaver californicum]|nr:hypothetical protein MKX01_035412 [Papaver californicum]